MQDFKEMTPPCSAKYIWLFQPNEKFAKGGVPGEYSVSCIMDDSQAWKDLQHRISSELDAYYDTQCKAAKRKLKKSPYLPWKEDSRQAGQMLFVPKNKARGTKSDGTTFEVKPEVYGPDLTPLTASDLKGPLSEGTELKVGFVVNFYNNDSLGVGVSCRLKWSQIIKPVYRDPFGGFGAVHRYTIDPNLFNPPSAKTDSHTQNIDGQEIEDIFRNATVEAE